mgnify:CR=1 FL=1
MMDEADKNILNEIQSGFPIMSRPFREIGIRVGLTEEDVLERVRRLKGEGIIRRIGANFHSSKLDFTSTLCAAKVPEETLHRFVKVVNRYPGVTHNYLRSHAYNVWFTFIAPSMAEIKANLRAISAETGITEILNLPATKVFKIKAQFDV